MTLASRSVVTAAVAAAIALAGYLHPVALLAVAAALVLVVAVGWPELAGLPFVPGSAAVVGMTGVAAVFAVRYGGTGLSGLAVVLACALMVSFVNELLRRDGRIRMVESVSGTVAGGVLSLSTAGWVAAEALAGGEAIVVAGALALAVGSAVAAFEVPRWVSALLTAVSATAAGAAAGWVLPTISLQAGVLLGVAVGVLVASLDALFDSLVELKRVLPSLSAAALPVAVSGAVVYVVGRVLVG
ncbi:MAG: hypothetical protein J0I40_12260 [Cellulomonas sp.]|uniref:hypothetical protein n=1 Tax=Cellulomonas sp. 73-92 TaxID=1895740 RepID=UPI00092B9F73|nr:hypothetical protein [Cellulomonas sp. 73-92]MBN9376133.1 hypothetical protein [Cellulomonas sp.]OJV81573.1 MAG: hypothetical protein BGO37_06495 [Cellulomonas sp. 73-92]